MYCTLVNRALPILRYDILRYEMLPEVLPPQGGS